LKNTDTFPGNSKYLIAYFILAFVISWAIGVPLALTHQGIIPKILPHWTHYLIPLGPLLSALIITLFNDGLPGLKDIFRRMFMLKVCPKWWFISFSPLILGSILLFIINRITGSAVSLSDLGMLNYLPPLGMWALLLWFLTFGIGEETGWRGFALPRLQKGRTALSAALILAAVWALWHLPQFFYLFDPLVAPVWLVGLFAGSVILTWLYNSTSDSVFMVAIWHACFNFIAASQADVGILQAVLIVVIILIAVIVIIRAKPKDLISL